MLAYLINSCIYPGRTSEYHAYMFHGHAFRSDVPYPGNVCHSFHDTIDEPLRLLLNAYDLHGVLLPCPGFVISDRVRSSLAQFKNIAFAPAVIDRLIFAPYSIGDFEYYRANGQASPFAVFNKWPHRPDLVPKVGLYWELLTWTVSESMGSYQDVREIEVRSDPFVTDSDRLEISPTQVEDFSILVTEFGQIVSANAFDSFAEHIDHDYYYVQKLQI